MPTSRRHYRITIADALEAHEAALRTGGRPGAQKWDDLLSAIGRPYHGYHRTIAQKAAALLEGVACSHGFVDGNKRTAILLTLLMIERSGYELKPARRGEDLDLSIEQFVLDVIAHALSTDEQVAWFKDRITR